MKIRTLIPACSILGFFALALRLPAPSDESGQGPYTLGAYGCAFATRFPLDPYLDITPTGDVTAIAGAGTSGDAFAFAYTPAPLPIQGLQDYLGGRRGGYRAFNSVHAKSSCKKPGAAAAVSRSTAVYQAGVEGGTMGSQFVVELSSPFRGFLEIQGVVFPLIETPPDFLAQVYFRVEIWKGLNADDSGTMQYETCAEGSATLTWDGMSALLIKDDALADSDFEPEDRGDGVLRYSINTEGSISFTAGRNDQIVVIMELALQTSANVSSEAGASTSLYAQADFGNSMEVELTTSTPGYHLYMRDHRAYLDIAPTNGGTQLTVTGPATGTYVLQSSPDLSQWTPFATNMNFTGSFTYLDTNAPAGVARFYRAAKVE